MNHCTCFSASVQPDAKILILGSMPGICSLEKQEYYAHPQNRFWPLMSEIFNQKGLPKTYQEKLDMLLSHKIALWDVIFTCQREGSLDSAITGEQVHDFSAFLTKYPLISRVYFNGGKAQSAYKKHVGFIFSDRIQYAALPSTSPANARWRYGDLLSEWKKALLQGTP